MFNLGSLKRTSIRATASSSFTNTLSNNLISAKDQLKEKEENADVRYQLIFTQAIDAIKKFTSSPGFDKNSFDEGADKLLEAIKIRSRRAEPYFYLSWLFCLTGNTEKALKYSKVASFINQDLNGIDLLNKEIAFGQNIQKPIKQNNIAMTGKTTVNTDNIASRMYSQTIRNSSDYIRK